jgi:N-formylglutamate deformylase
MHPVLKLIQTRAQVTSVAGHTPLVLDSPHSGTVYPDDFRPVCDLATLRRAEDTHVEKLYAFAPAMGAAWIEAHFPRSYLDANRDTTEVDTTLLDGAWTEAVSDDPRVLSKVRLGKGLIWKLTDEGLPIYDRLLGWTRCAGASTTAGGRTTRRWPGDREAHARHGYSIHINCHSMPAVAGSHATDFPGLAHADFVIGDRDGSTADPALSHKMCEHLRELRLQRGLQPPVQGRGAGAPPRRPGGEPAQHPGRDQPQALHGRGHAGAGRIRRGAAAGAPAVAGRDAAGDRSALTNNPADGRCVAAEPEKRQPIVAASLTIAWSFP